MYHFFSFNDETEQTYTFYFFDEPGDKAIDTEGADLKEKVINGNKAIVVRKDGNIRILMYKEGRQFCVQGNLEEELPIIMLLALSAAAYAAPRWDYLVLVRHRNKQLLLMEV